MRQARSRGSLNPRVSGVCWLVVACFCFDLGLYPTQGRFRFPIIFFSFPKNGNGVVSVDIELPWTYIDFSDTARPCQCCPSLGTFSSPGSSFTWFCGLSDILSRQEALLPLLHCPSLFLAMPGRVYFRWDAPQLGAGRIGKRRCRVFHGRLPVCQ